MLENFKNIKEENIEIYYKNEEESIVNKTFSGLKNAYKTLSKYFETNSENFDVKAIIAHNRKEYEDVVLNVLKVNIEIPSRRSRIAQPQGKYLVLLSPNAYEKDSIYSYIEDDYERLIFHEVTHMFEEYLSKDMENSSLWFGEGLAVYLSKQSKYEDEFRHTVCESIQKRNVPTLEEIEGKFEFAYEWGWTLIKYIEEVYGKQMINDILRNYDNGKVLEYMKVNKNIFEEQWKKYVLNKNNIN